MKNIIAIHGAGMGPDIWAPLVPFLAPHRIHAVSLPPLSSVSEMAKIINLEEPSILMGHSLGALVALEMAQQPCVEALVLMGVAPKMPVHPDLLKQAKENPVGAAELVLKWGVFENPPLQALLKPLMNPVTLFAHLSACDAYQGGQAPEKPVLVIAGEKDKMTRVESGRELADMIPGAVFKKIPACGHMMMAEAPEKTGGMIKVFLDILCR